MKIKYREIRKDLESWFKKHQNAFIWMGAWIFWGLVIPIEESSAISLVISILLGLLTWILLKNLKWLAEDFTEKYLEKE